MIEALALAFPVRPPFEPPVERKKPAVVLIASPPAPQHWGEKRMGAWFVFTCSKCGYWAKVSGGKDVGMLVAVETMVCRTCGELVDVPTRWLGPGPGRNRLVGRCPRCGGVEVEPWPESHPCPKCGGAMSQGELVAVWD